MSLPRPDLSPHPSAHLPLDVSRHMAQSTLICSHLCTPFYLLLSSVIQPFLLLPTSCPLPPGSLPRLPQPTGLSLPSGPAGTLLIENPDRPLVTRVRNRVGRVLPCRICCAIVVRFSVAGDNASSCGVREKRLSA